jgi:cardiolipin synthase
MTLAHLPNALTVLRIALVPVLILFLKDREYPQALVVFLVSGFSDALDGFLARRYGFTTRIGAVLDPAADKVLLVSAYVMLAILGHIPFWLLLAVVFRDLLIVGGFLVYTSLYGAVQMHPSLLSKLNTLMQIVLVAVILFEQAAMLVVPGLAMILIFATFATTVASGIHYLWHWLVRREVIPETPAGPGTRHD